MKAIVLLSGGLDSAVAAAVAGKRYEHLVALTFVYGQRHYREAMGAIKLAKWLGCEWHELMLPKLGPSALTDPTKPIEEFSDGRLPTSFVPARNLIFISVAASWAYADKANIVGGWNVVDYSGYPDCRPEFLDAAGAAVNLALGLPSKIDIDAPLLHLNKAQIIKLGAMLGVPFQDTWSCYIGDRKPCGECPSCKIRAKGFAEAGIADPLLEGGDQQ
jgi:7-cyano-7-deazaguanine synthase